MDKPPTSTPRPKATKISPAGAGPCDLHNLTPSAVIAAVCLVFRMNRWDFVGSKGKRKPRQSSEASEARSVAVWLLHTRCGLDAARAGLELNLDRCTVVRLYGRAKSRLGSDLLFENRTNRAALLAGGSGA